MDEAAYLRLIRGQTRGPLASSGRGALGVASALYGLGISARNRAYDRGWKAAHQTSVPVVSIVNITLGGTGKTPMVEWVSRWYRERDLRVAILSRGYGGEGGVNDEAMVLEENLPDVPHLQDPDRVRMAQVAVEELESQILVLDDGFQHRRLARDLDIVLLDALDPFGLGRIFPRGLLREPVSSLRRAQVIVLSRSDMVSELERKSIRERAERTSGPLRWVEARHTPRDLIGTGVGPDSLGGLTSQRIAAFCGIGNPEGFRRTLAGLGVDLIDLRSFPDHHAYQSTDVESLIAWARDLRPDLVLTTQKDLVKLRLERLGQAPLRALRIGLEILHGLDQLEESLASVLPRSSTTGKDSQ
jgi:tetraacyldisaccharide 4'-kinase